MEGFSFENRAFGKTEKFRKPDDEFVETLNGTVERLKEELIGEATVLSDRIKKLREIFDGGKPFPEEDAAELEMKVNELIPLLADIVDTCDDFDERTRVVSLLDEFGSFVAWREGRIQ
jgi:hypothetical protein